VKGKAEEFNSCTMTHFY